MTGVPWAPVPPVPVCYRDSPPCHSLPLSPAFSFREKRRQDLFRINEGGTAKNVPADSSMHYYSLSFA